MFKNTDFAYAAGYIDGDGCFHLGYSKNKFINSLIVTSVNKEVFYYFKQMFNGSIYTKIKIVPGHKQLHYYTLKKHDSYQASSKLIPYLIERREEAKIFIRFIETRDMSLIHKIKILKKKSNLVFKKHKKEFEKVKNTIKPTLEDFAYLAGFIDAECHLGIQRYKTKTGPNYVYKILLQFSDTKAPVFKWLCERFGGNINFINRRNSKKHTKNQLCWRLTSKSLSKILNDIYPFLRHKKDICGELIKFYNTTLINGGARHTEKFRSQYAEVIKIREEIVTNIHKLNLKGNIKNT